MAAPATAVFIPDRFNCQQIGFYCCMSKHRMIIVAARRWLDRIPAADLQYSDPVPAAHAFHVQRAKDRVVMFRRNRYNAAPRPGGAGTA
ncbi:hypothetical protein [Novilysobacter antarcticus]|uniref:hypothetical protein n=1 Tax=Novilysobacter antarcticus TaxID=2862543 RepID=UPI001C99DC69|nr:hypothetical protein [Lysobacter antarcticus]